MSAVEQLALAGQISEADAAAIAAEATERFALTESDLAHVADLLVKGAES